MARIRTIKPEFFTSEDIVSRSPIARLFYVALWCEADREGRMEWKPGTFKLRYLPGDDVTVDEVASELIDAGLICIYTVGEKQYAEIPSFKKHQVINNREADSAIPTREHASTTRGARVKAPSARAKAEGEEGKGKEGKEPASSTRFDDFWNAWPKSERKQDRSKCADKWKSNGFDDLSEVILADIATKKLTQKWQGGFIEAPEVYLNNRRWEDGVTPDAPAADVRTTTVPAKPGRDPALVRLDQDAAKAKPMPPEIRQALAQAVGRMTQ